MESILVKRPLMVEDEYGNTVPGDLVTVKTLSGLVSPQSQDEPKLVGRSPVETNYNIYFPGITNTGILATDILGVRGEDTPVDGRISRWLEPPYGEHLQVRLVRG